MANNQDIITVLVPVYNSPDIKATINSILIQTYRYIQLIILDDGSDNFDTGSIEKYIKQNAKNVVESIVLHNAQNIGTVKNLNQGLSLSKGKIIIFLAGDDAFFDEKVIEDWVQEFNRTNSNIITAKRMLCDELMQSSGEVAPTKEQIKWIEELSPRELYEKLCQFNFIFGCCTAIRKDFIAGIGGFDEKYRLIEDYPFVLKASRRKNEITFFDRLVVKYRDGGASSAKHYSRGYKADSDKIFMREILPYVKHKYRAFCDYRKWRRGQDRNKYEYLDKNNKFYLVLYKVSFAIKYPEAISEYIRHKMRR